MSTGLGSPILTEELINAGFNFLSDAPFGPDYVWNDHHEYWEAMSRLRMTPYQMAREFREVFDQPLDEIDVVDVTGCSTPEDRLGFNLIEEEFKEVTLAYYDEDLGDKETSEAFAKELGDLVYVIYGYAAYRGWNLDKIVSRIHLSNLSKCDPVTGQPIKREDGKVLKGPNYKKPYLKDLV